eukprot:4145049-Amphidinium_carterae.1
MCVQPKVLLFDRKQCSLTSLDNMSFALPCALASGGHLPNPWQDWVSGRVAVSGERFQGVNLRCFQLSREQASHHPKDMHLDSPYCAPANSCARSKW